METLPRSIDRQRPGSLQNLRDRPDRPDRTQFYPSDRGRLSRPGRLSFIGSFIVRYDRPDRLIIFLRRLERSGRSYGNQALRYICRLRSAQESDKIGSARRAHILIKAEVLVVSDKRSYRSFTLDVTKTENGEW